MSKAKIGCKKCGNDLAFTNQVCTDCGNFNSPETVMRKSYMWVFVIYFLVEFLGFIFFIINFILQMGGGDIDMLFNVYLMLRVILFITAICIFFKGKEQNTTSLKSQGGCFLILNFLIIGIIIYAFLFGF